MSEDSARLLEQTPSQIEDSVLASSRLPFLISAGCFFGLLGIVFIPPVVQMVSGRFVRLIDLPISSDDGFAARFLMAYSLHLLMFFGTLISGYIGYKLVTASGARTDTVILAQDYRLLAPLVAEGKAEAIDQYVRLSSLSGFTGSFTKLGLTGLPLATIALTLAFSLLAFAKPEFLDLAKLTLGAFIGSFVQRQVENRANKSSGDEAKIPKP